MMVKWKERLFLAARRNLLRSETAGDDGKRVELFFWSASSGNENFGDYLSLVIVSKLLAKAGLSLMDATHEQARLLAIGSILHFARTGDHIWGTGLNGKI